MSRAAVRCLLSSGLIAAVLVGLAGAVPGSLSPGGGPALAASAAAVPGEAGEVVVIRATMDESGRFVYFDPIGVWVKPGTTIRWVLERSFHSVAAYHPQNGGRELRIPEGALPWDSGMLLEEGATFEVTLTVPGVYDYFCLPHELAGMVGRIIVGEATGPGAMPFNYGTAQGWVPVPEAAQRAFPSIERILAEKVVRFEPGGSAGAGEHH